MIGNLNFTHWFYFLPHMTIHIKMIRMNPIEMVYIVQNSQENRTHMHRESETIK